MQSKCCHVLLPFHGVNYIHLVPYLPIFPQRKSSTTTTCTSSGSGATTTTTRGATTKCNNSLIIIYLQSAFFICWFAPQRAQKENPYGVTVIDFELVEYFRHQFSFTCPKGIFRMAFYSLARVIAYAIHLLLSTWMLSAFFAFACARASLSSTDSYHDSTQGKWDIRRHSIIPIDKASGSLLKDFE